MSHFWRQLMTSNGAGVLPAFPPGINTGRCQLTFLSFSQFSFHILVILEQNSWVTCCSRCCWWLLKLGSIQVQLRSQLPCHDWCQSTQCLIVTLEREIFPDQSIFGRHSFSDKGPLRTTQIHPTLSSWQMTSVATLPCV